MEETLSGIKTCKVCGIRQFVAYLIKSVATFNWPYNGSIKGFGVQRYIRSLESPCLCAITKELSHSGVILLSSLVIVPWHSMLSSSFLNAS